MILSLADIPVLILAGGKGTRLQSVVSDVPKPMAPIGRKPFLEYILSYLKKYGFRKIVFLTGYKAEVIRDYFGDGRHLDLEIQYSNEDQPQGTGGAVRQALKNRTEQRFVILNGDTFYNIDYASFVSQCEAPVNMALHRVNSAGRYGTVKVGPNQMVTAFTEKNPQIQEGEINAGIYLIDRSLLEAIPEGFVSLESDVFPKLVQTKSIKGISMSGDFIDIGIPEDYLRAQSEVPRWA